MFILVLVKSEHFIDKGKLKSREIQLKFGFLMSDIKIKTNVFLSKTMTIYFDFFFSFVIAFIPHKSRNLTPSSPPTTIDHKPPLLQLCIWKNCWPPDLTWIFKSFFSKMLEILPWNRWKKIFVSHYYLENRKITEKSGKLQHSFCL